VPAEALAEGDGKTGYVYTLNPDRRTVKKNPVRIAFLQKDKIAISSGLENTSEVITEGVGYLTDGAVVKPVN
jgi:multidrug efflux pump subunit AcrA (membrane-fusion protein)